MSKKRKGVRHMSMEDREAAQERLRAKQIASRGATAAFRAVEGNTNPDAVRPLHAPRPYEQRPAVADDDFRERAGMKPQAKPMVHDLGPELVRSKAGADRVTEEPPPYVIPLADAISVTRQVVQNLHAEADKVPWTAWRRRREIRAKAHDQFIALGVMERVRKQIEDSLR